MWASCDSDREQGQIMRSIRNSSGDALGDGVWGQVWCMLPRSVGVWGIGATKSQLGLRCGVGPKSAMALGLPALDLANANAWT